MKRASYVFFSFFFLFFILILTLARTLPTDKKTLLVVSEINVSKDFFVVTEKQISGHHFNDLHFIQVKNNPRSCEVNLCNCVRSLKKIQDFKGIPFFLSFFSGIHCVHNCEEHSSLDFISAVLIYDLFHIHLSHYISLSSQKS